MTEITPEENTYATARSKRMVWLWFGPLIAIGLLQYWLGWRAQSLAYTEPISSAPYVQTPAGNEQEAINAMIWKASQPLLITVATIVIVVFISWRAVRRWGWRRMTPVFTGVWCAFWIAAAGVMVARYINRVNQVDIPDVSAVVIAAVPYPSTSSSPGGALTWLQPPDGISQGNIPWRVRIWGANFNAMPAGTVVTLKRARGALWGEYLTGSNAPQVPKAQDMPDAPSD